MTFEEYWNSSEMKSIRLKMLNNEAPHDDCHKCKFGIQAINQFKSHFDQFGSIEQIKQETNEDGSYQVQPTYYDYRINNLCQLSCRMCNADFSSKIEKAYNALSFDRTSEVNKKDFFSEILDSVNARKLSKVYWASGEAFLQKEHWQLIDKCRDIGITDQLMMIYNTNLSFAPSKFREYLNKLEGLREIRFAVSVDGCGDVGEFIRDGLNWNFFIENLNFISQKYFYRFNVTLTIPGLLNLSPLFKLYSLYPCKLSVILCDDKGESSLLSPVNLDKKSFNLLISKVSQEVSLFPLSDLKLKIEEILEFLRGQSPKEFSDEEWLREIVAKYNRNKLLDQKLNRKSLFDYYLERPLLETWAANIIHFDYFNEIKQRVHALTLTNKIWSAFLQPQRLHNRIIANFHFQTNDLALEEFFTKSKLVLHSGEYISIIHSVPSFLSRLLTRDHSKYHSFHYIKEKAPQSFEIVQRRAIPLLSLAFQKNKFVLPLMSLLDRLISPLLPLITFQEHLLLRKI